MKLNTHKVILLVEDNPNDAELTRLAFESNQITNPVILTRDGVEALDYLFGTGMYTEACPELPALLILDLKLPRVDGLEVLQTIRANAKTQLLPVVILTSSKEERDVIEAYKLGTNAYVRKPVDFIEFQEAVKLLGLFWLLLNECP
jgi:two-component system response regulator